MALEQLSDDGTLNQPTPLAVIEVALRSYLREQVPGLQYEFMRLNQKAKYPAAVITFTGKDREHTLAGASGKVIATVTFDVYSQKYLEALGYVEALRQVLYGFSGDMSSVPVLSILLDDESSQYVEAAGGSDTPLYQISVSYLVTYLEPLPMFLP